MTDRAPFDQNPILMEQEILQLLKQCPGTVFSAKEVGKRIDRKQFKENPNWARPMLEGLLEKKVISTDVSGYYVYQAPTSLRDRA